ncbi:ankyrin repeat domain-containing protein [Mycolicibacterium smegmatis]|uniref:ankyrin repeat domain-containing protein n=1 Tax=Mycolicibacterium smegmatis TaxID=1772 RepID=UPI001E3684F4|nr:ankyrin repeat domain-containing protein [Mycolicibacterium smegmatis]UGU29886.1 ankyrin repeat domain-containing protein [Mycolicibacterium smegmatis]ULN70823.1 ankyrin repeat domain-containing protein [Mycolicibacterium smegmatis]
MTAQRDQAGRTPLHYAAIDPPVGLKNIEAQTNPALAAENFRASNDYRVANTQRLLREGADVNAADDQGMTPLHFAVQRDSVDVVRLLLDAGADANLPDFKGETPLYKAVRASLTPAKVEIIKLLREHGADPTIQTEKGSSALRYITRLGTPEEREVFSDLL